MNNDRMTKEKKYKRNGSLTKDEITNRKEKITNSLI